MTPLVSGFSGVHQGFKLSPLLFVIYKDKLVKDCKFVSDVKVKDYSLRSLLYADDLVLISRSANGLQHNLERLSRTCDEFGMKINLEKTKAMVISKKQKPINCLVEGRILKQVSNFNYLGVIIDESGRLDKELDNRIRRAGKVSSQLHKAIFCKK